MPTTDTDGTRWLEAALVALLRTDALADMHAEDLPERTDQNDAPVDVSAVHRFSDVGILTRGHGVYLELSDGSAYTLTIGVDRRSGPPAPPEDERRPGMDNGRI